MHRGKHHQELATLAFWASQDAIEVCAVEALTQVIDQGLQINWFGEIARRAVLAMEA
jgi:hypothetical protein